MILDQPDPMFFLRKKVPEFLWLLQPNPREDSFGEIPEDPWDGSEPKARNSRIPGILRDLIPTPATGADSDH